MTFNEIKGNGTVVAALKGMVDTGKVPHAVMLHEEDAGGAFYLSGFPSISILWG